MAKNVFIASTERRSGKSLFALGLIHALQGIVPKVGYMKPIGKDSDDGVGDQDVRLIKSVFNLDDDLAHMSPMGLDQAQRDKDAHFERIFGCHNYIAEGKDIVVIEGTDYDSSVSALEFDINAELARNFVAPVLLVVNGEGKEIADITGSVRDVSRSFSAQGCTLLGAVVNRFSSEDLRADTKRIAEELERDGIALYGVILDNPMLSGPRLREVAETLGATIISQGDDLSKIVTSTRILAMIPENALRYMREGDGYLLVTPGDRSEHILTAISAQKSSHFPICSGIVLTGGLGLGPETTHLIDGIGDVDLSILSVEDDTYTTALKVNTIAGELRADDTEKVNLALEAVKRYVDVEKIYREMGSTRSDMVTPRMFQYRIIEKAKAEKKLIVLPEASELRVLKAAEEVLHRGICDVVLLGDKQKISWMMEKNHIEIGQSRIIDVVADAEERRDEYAHILLELRRAKGITIEKAQDSMLDPIVFGTMMVHTGAADGYVSGAVNSTADTLRPALQIIRTDPGVSLASSIFFMCMHDQVVVYGDCALVSNPTPEELADIAITSADTAKSFGIDPFVAMLSYSTGESGLGTDVDRVRMATQIVKEKRSDIPIEGPIQYDAATSMEVAAIKTKDSSVAGRATVYIFPDLDAGNTAYKAVQRSANVPAIGPVMQGLNKPANDLSRGATVADIVYTIAITAIQAQG